VTHQAKLTPDEALKELIDGNRRFAEGASIHPNTSPERRAEVMKGQKPLAAVVTCSDSRVPPEIIFDRGIGALFVVRLAGNILDGAGVASIDYAIRHLGCPIVVVLGHTSCGAVTASLAADDDLMYEPASIIGLVKTIRRNIPGVMSRADSLVNAVNDAAVENALAVTGSISGDSAVRERIAEGKTMVKPAFYSLETGVVSWL
jgi:carbonic anhydrase